MKLNKSIATTWRLFDVAPVGQTAFTRSTIILAPLAIGLGLFFFFLSFLAFPLWVSLLISIAAFGLTMWKMITATQHEEALVDRMLSDRAAVEFRLPTGLIDKIPNNVRPDYYQGAGEWIALGHVDHVEFVDAIKVLDPFIASIPDQALFDMVQESYVINTYSPRNDRDAIRFVPEGTPDSYPVTNLHVPYDHYINSGYPDPPIRVTPTPYLFENRKSRES